MNLFCVFFLLFGKEEKIKDFYYFNFLFYAIHSKSTFQHLNERNSKVHQKNDLWNISYYLLLYLFYHLLAVYNSINKVNHACTSAPFKCQLVRNILASTRYLTELTANRIVWEEKITVCPLAIGWSSMRGINGQGGLIWLTTLCHPYW